MAVDSTATIAIVGVLGTTVGALVWVIKFIFQKMLPLIEKTAEATAANTEATKAADQYLRDRNGRDAAMHKQIIESMKGIPKAIQAIADSSTAQVTQSLHELPEQHVKKQVVEQVEKKEKDGVL